MGMTGPEKLLRAVFPTKAKQLAYHRVLEEYFADRGRPMKIFWFMGRWEIKWLKK